MRIEKKMTSLVNSALGQLDSLGYQLDVMGVDNRINRHNLIAFALFNQKRVEGELDSLSAKIGSTKAKANALVDITEQFVKSGVNLALMPATYTIERVRAQF